MFEYPALSTETIRIQGHNGDEIAAYLARPTGSGPHPGVVVIHHAPGWDEGTMEIVRKFAHHGYAAVSPNLYFRDAPDATPDDAAAAARAAGGVPDERCIGDVEGAARYLLAQPSSNGKLGVIGYCSGGRQTYLVSCKSTLFSAAVDCYGGGVITPPERLTERQPVSPFDLTKDLACPLLGLFGEEDRNPDQEMVAKMDAELKRLAKTYEFHRYPNTGHGFFSSDRASYRIESAMDGWQQIFKWYGKYLAAEPVAARETARATS
jgi:carboxymethylenebutenolidase